MNILVLGGGGREHALVTSLAASSLSDTIFVAPGNGGSAPGARNVVLDMMDAQAVVAFAQENAVELVVIGPEAPLVAGVGDVVRAAGILCFGPGALGARMEGSKQFSKEFMGRHNIPTAAFEAFTNAADALAYLKTQSAPVVVKADGLAAGKGVTVAETIEEAEQAVRECFEGRFGEAGATVIIEECMTGPECSLLVFTDGRRVLPMDPAQDHKRAHEGDTGPNTGGMGVYSPVPLVKEDEYAAMLRYMEAAVAGLAAEGIDYRGVLYGGFMLTENGPKVLEFNARFGDPETQVVLPRLKSDLLEALLAVACGNLEGTILVWEIVWAVSVVIASAGYPGDYEKGKPITGISDAEALEGVTVFHAGTKRLADGTLVTNGGRVLNVTAVGESFEEARERAYQACELINFEGAWYRRDIGARALVAFDKNGGTF
ncbi:MAG: phosphoribosylamine--glycine ligase [Coriobacteriales bacterium]|jgi:phosphoribosylamine--glycine ligase|nr:phosphoribosylamine--glycine ligase [Coriobacteriales bacterium]